MWVEDRKEKCTGGARGGTILVIVINKHLSAVPSSRSAARGHVQKEEKTKQEKEATVLAIKEVIIMHCNQII